jgi:hypothetical protein
MNASPADQITFWSGVFWDEHRKCRTEPVNSKNQETPIFERNDR